MAEESLVIIILLYFAYNLFFSNRVFGAPDREYSVLVIDNDQE